MLQEAISICTGTLMIVFRNMKIGHRGFLLFIPQPHSLHELFFINHKEARSRFPHL